MVVIAAVAVCIATSSAPVPDVFEINCGFDGYRRPSGIS
jgi:hypothetical protein